MFTNDNTGSGGLVASDDATMAFLDDLHEVQIAAPPAAPEAPVAPAAPAARPPEKAQVAQPMQALAQALAQGGAPAEQVEVPQIIQVGGGDVRLTRFAGSETIAMRGGPTMTFLATGGYETDQAVRVTPLNPGFNNFGGKGGRMPGDFNPRTEYRFAGGQWVVTDAQGPVQFFDGRNEYVLVPDNNGVRNRVAILQR